MNGRARERTRRPGLDSFSDIRSLGFSSAELRRLPEARHLQQALSRGLLFALTLVVLLLAQRRLSGALERPLSAGLLLVSAVALASCAASIRQLADLAPTHKLPAALFKSPHVYLPTLLLVVAAFALSLPGTSVWGLTLFWLLLVAAEAGSLRLGWRRSRGRERPGDARAEGVASRHPDMDASNDVDSPPASDELASATQSSEPVAEEHVGDERPVAEEELDEVDAELAELLPDDDVTQQMVRRRQPDGKQAVSGSLRCEFVPGERTTTAHLAFCPPFDGPPTFSAEPMAGPGAQVRVVQVLAYGVRLEVKLDAMCGEAQSVLIGFEAWG